MISTERLKIRLIEEKDIEDLFEIYKDEDVCRYTLEDAWTENNKNQKFQKLLEQRDLLNYKKVSFVVESKEKVIGNILAWFTEMKNTVEIGYIFNPDYSGQGFASESVTAVVKYIFEEIKAHRIQAVLDARNISSANLCSRIGFRKEAHFIKDYWSKGEWTDTLIFGMLRDEFIINNDGEL